MAIKFQGFTGGGGAAVGGLTYKGTFNATAGTPDISNAIQGDLYVIDVAGTIYGQTWAINDHLLVNADMGGVISNSKIDKVDNTSDTALQIANNLSDLNNASTARTNLALGTAAVEDTGTAVGDMPILVDIGGGVAGFSAIDGSNLTGITASGSLLVANNLSDLNNVTTARSNLGLGTAATTASTDYLAVANDLSDLNSAVTARTNLGLGTSATTASTDYLAVSNNLSDLNNATTARTNLGLGTAAVEDTGIAVGDMPILVDIGGGVAGFSAIDGSNLTGITASGALLVANNLSDLNNATTARTNLGLGTAATTASTDYLAVANNLSDLNNTTTARTNLGLGTAATTASTDYLAVANDLSDLNSSTTARTNLGLGTAAVEDTGVAVGDMPILVDIGGGVAGFSAVDGSNLTGITASGSLLVANNLSDLNNTTTARTNLGLGSAATTASTAYLAVTSNLSDLNNAGTARTNLGLGTAATTAASAYLAVTNNLSDLNNAGTARTNLALGTAAVEDTGVAVGDMPILVDIGGGVAGFSAIDGSNLTGITASGALLVANNLSDLNNVTTARTNLGLGSAATTASTAYLAVSNNLSDLNNATTARSNLGLGSSATTASTAYLAVANNLSDLNNAGTARTNLALGTAAVEDTGTAVGDMPILVDIGGGVAGFSAVDGSNLTGITASGSLLVANNLSDLNNVTTARSNLGLGSAATTASSDYLAVANNLSDLNNATTARTNLGLGTSATTASTDYLAVANNLSDLNNATTARSNLSLGTAAVEDTGTAVGDMPILVDIGGGVAGFSAIDGSNLTGLPSGGLAAVVDDTTPQLGGSLDVNGQSIVSVSNGDITIAPNGSGVIKTTGSIEPDADLTRTVGTESLRYLTSWTDINGAIRFKAKNDSGGTMTKGQVVYIKGISGSVPTVDLARSNSASTMPAFGLVHANANDQAEVTIITLGNLNDVNTTTYSLSVGDTVYVSSATAGALTNTAPTGESNLIQNIGRVVRADASAGIIKVGGAGRSAATPNLDNDKIFLGNGSGQAVSTLLSAVNLTSLNQDLTTSTVAEGTNEYFTTARVDTQIATLPMSTLSDVAYTAGAGIDNYVLTYDHSSTSWGAEAAAGGGGGGARPTVTDITATPYTVGTTDGAIGASELERTYTASTGAGTVNLPTAVGLSGFKLQIKRLTSGAVTVDPDGTEHIDHAGQTTFAIGAQYDSITLQSDNANWILI